MRRMLVKRQTLAIDPEYSMGSEHFADLNRLLRDLYVTDDRRMLKYLSKVYYTPIPICEAMAYLGDERCIQVAEANSILYQQCISAAAVGAIQAGHTELFERLRVNILRDDEYLSRTLHITAERRDLHTFRKLQAHSGEMTPEIGLMIATNGWAREFPGLYPWIASDDVESVTGQRGMRELRLDRRGSVIERCHIVSTRMIDILLQHIGWIAIWRSLFRDLDGTPERLALIRYLDSTPRDAHDRMTLYGLEMNTHPDDMSSSMRAQMIDYISTSPVLEDYKLQLLLSGLVLDPDSIDSLLIEVTPYDAEDLYGGLIGDHSLKWSRDDDRWKIPCALKLIDIFKVEYLDRRHDIHGPIGPHYGCHTTELLGAIAGKAIEILNPEVSDPVGEACREHIMMIDTPIHKSMQGMLRGAIAHTFYVDQRDDLDFDLEYPVLDVPESIISLRISIDDVQDVKREILRRESTRRSNP